MKKLKLTVLLLGLIWCRGFALDYMGDLGTVVVTPTGAGRAVSLVPSNVKIITSDELKKSAATSIADILRAENGIFIQDYYGNGKMVRVDMAGYGDMAPQTVLVLVDGRTMDNPDLEGINWNQITPGQIERIEIIKGSGNVVYGDNANAGVINIITRKGTKEVKKEVSYLSGSYGLTGGKGFAGGPLGPFSGSLNLYSKDTDGYRDNGGSRDRGISGNLTYIEDKLKVGINTGYNIEEYGMPGDLSVKEINEGRSRTDTDDPGNNVRAYDSYIQSENLWEFVPDIRVNLDYIYQQKLKDVVWATGGMENTRNSFANTADIKLITDKELNGNKNRFTAGYEGEFDLLVSKWPTSKDKIEVTAGAPYIIEEFFLMENFMLTSGWRRQNSEYNFKSEGTGFFGNEISTSSTISRTKNAFKFGASWLFNSSGRIYAGYDSSFRFPKTDQFYSMYSSPSLNNELKPESSKEIHTGLEYLYKNFISGGIHYRYSVTENEIYLDSNMGFFGKNINYEENIGREIIEIEGKLNPIDRLGLGVGYSLIKAEFSAGEYRGNEVPGVPKSKAEIYCSLELTPQLNLKVAARNIGKRYLINDLKNEEEKMDAFTRADISLSYSISDFSIAGRINNIGNKKYSEYGALGSTGIKGIYPSPKRNYSLEIAMRY